MNPFFSESWHRVSGHAAWLKPGVRVHKQTYRGEPWYVLHDPLSNQFFRIRAGAWHFVGRLRRGVTIEQVWRDCLELDPEDTPGQNEVIQILGQLHQSNLIASDLPPDSSRVLKRRRVQEKKEFQSRLQSFLTPRFTLFDPDPFLRALMPIGKICFTNTGLIVWLGMVFWGIKVAIDNADSIRSSSEGLLAPTNLPVLYALSALIKLLHETAHGLSCRVRGGEVHACGVALILLVPLPYVDATSSYAFRRKRDRVLVGASGMMCEFAIAAIAVWVWAATGPGLINGLAYNVMFLCTVTTLFFNANPLLKFDGYYILCDLIDEPNLQTRAQNQLRAFAERTLFGVKHALSETSSRLHAFLLCLFGLASFAFKLVLIVVILQVVAGMFMGIGFFLAFILIGFWAVLPLAKMVHYLAVSPRLRHHRFQAVGVTAGGLSLLLLFAAFVPFPHHFRAPGVVRSVEESGVFPQVDGVVVETLVPTGQRVTRDQPLLRLQNPEIAMQIRAQEARIRSIEARRNAAIPLEIYALDGINQELQAARAALALWQNNAKSLIVRAPQDGIWVCPNWQHIKSTLLLRGTPVGVVAREEQLHFRAVVSQKDAARIVETQNPKAEVRLLGRAHDLVRVSRLQVIPAEQEQLPSAALGWKLGGEVEVKADDKDGTKPVESFYLVNAFLDQGLKATFSGKRTGQIRFQLASQPLLLQWRNAFLHLLQKRYSL